MLRRTKILTAMMATGLIAGCTSMPSIDDYERQTTYDARDIALQSSSWTSRPAIIRNEVEIGQLESAKNYIPEEIRNRQIDVELTPDTTFQDFVTGLTQGLGISGYIASDDIANRRIYIPKYSGDLGSLLDSISRNLKVSFIFGDNTLTLNDSIQYVVSIPNNPEVADNIKDLIERLGGTNVLSDHRTATVTYNATKSVNERVEGMLERMVANSANINLQVLFINVNIDNERRKGFDWSGLQATVGDLGVASIDMTDRATGLVGRITGNSVSARLSRSEVDIDAMFNILNTYGEARTLQDFNMSTISGGQVQVKSVQKTPYIDELTSSTTVDSVTSSGINTKTAENGIEVNFVPVYDSKTGIVSLDIDMSLSTLLGFMSLNAGDRGTIEQPRIQEQTFNNSLRLGVGDTVVLGGITYSSVSDNRNMPFIFEAFDMDLASQNVNITENSLFIVLRTSVIEFVPVRLGGE